MNRNAAWKVILLLLVVAFGSLYALPNVFGEDAAVQVAPVKGQVDSVLLGRIERTLKRANIAPTRVSLEEGRLLARFENTEVQLAAADVLKEQLGRNYIVALNLASKMPKWLKSFGAQPMSLGLDLRGGVHFLIEVDIETAKVNAMERYENDLKRVFRENKLRYRRIRADGTTINLELRSAQQREDAFALLTKEFPELAITDPKLLEDPTVKKFPIGMTVEEQERLRKFAIEQNLTTLRNRVNQLGVSEPVVQQQGKSRIVLELPGVQDPAQVKDIISATATVEYRLLFQGSGDADDAARTGRVPEGAKLYRERDSGLPVLLKRSIIASGAELVNAVADIDPDTGRPMVSVTLDSKGARNMSRTTRENVGKPMAVVFIEYETEEKKRGDKIEIVQNKIEEVINIANIQEPFGKRFRTTGLDPDEAPRLARLLRAGALAAPIYIVEERTVGPSMGQENIEQGFRAVLIGFALVVFFMVFYYRGFGLVANSALLLNLILIVGVMSLLQATLTLPGIAGVVLTVGMAVDANVLIFERIREELRGGNTPQGAIFSGYQKAFSTIADANVTTLIAAVVLFALGSGPVKGFAITLAIGIATSMFTSILGTRVIVNTVYGRRDLQKLSI